MFRLKNGFICFEHYFILYIVLIFHEYKLITIMKFIDNRENLILFLFQWNYVCKYKWMEALAKSAYFFGVFFGAVTLGRLADK